MVDFMWEKDSKNNKNDGRPTWDEYFLKIAMLVSERSTCLRHHVGSVIVKNRRILTTGYNGGPRKVKDCLQLGCLRDKHKIQTGTKHELCRAIHAEQNAIIQAGNHGIQIDGGTIYCTHSPCILCAKMIVNAGLKRFVTYGDYPDRAFIDLFREAGIKYDVLGRPKEKINSMD